MKALNELTIIQAAQALRARECTVRELWDACYRAAQEKNPELNAFLEIFDADDTAIEAAQKRIDEGDSSPLCGVPLALKDNILIEGKVASAASRMLENYKATYDATVVTKLKEAGALFVGRTNMDEFALGGSTENSAFGVTRNPHDLSRVAGGTSGGSATAVAAHLCIAALGTDTGGSVRNPASYCGVVGLKPTYGAVSRSGIIAAASSFDQVGPITKTIEDAKIVFEVIGGPDPLDATSVPGSFYKTGVPGEKLRIGVLRSLVSGEGISSDMKTTFEAMLEKIAQEGHTICDVDIPLAKPALAAYYIINFAEVSTNLSRYDGVRYGYAMRGNTLLDDYIDSRTGGFGRETLRRILLGTFVLSSGYIDAYYRKADAARTALRHEFTNAFDSVDVIVTPTMPTPAFKVGEKSDPLAMYLEDVFTITANLTGMPALSVPMGTVVRDGMPLPIGMHFTAPHGGESTLFEAAALVEKTESK